MTQLASLMSAKVATVLQNGALGLARLPGMVAWWGLGIQKQAV
jgi:hypothetical protein